MKSNSGRRYVEVILDKYIAPQSLEDWIRKQEKSNTGVSII
jgi:hypothetical protein